MDNTDNMRPSWQEYFKEITLTTSKRSVCPRLKVGALLVKDNRIIAQGYNGYISGCPHQPIIENGHNIATIHAELNAILDCAKRGVSCENSDIYITHFPCLNCVKSICSVGINNVYYINDYNNDNRVYDLTSKKNISLLKI